MSTIEQYTFEDANGHEYGSFTTFNITEAREYAQANKVRLVANTYEFSDSELVEDYTDENR